MCAHTSFVSPPSAIAQITTVHLALMAIVVAGLTIYMIATRKRIHRSLSQPRATSRDRFADRQRQVRLSRDVEEVMGELDELAQQVNGKLDIRFAKLETVIRDADARIAQLTHLTRTTTDRARLDVTVDDEVSEAPVSNSAPAPDDPASSEPPLHGDVYALADRGIAPVDIALQTNRTTGEIDLILALRRAKAQADATPAPSAPST